MNSYLILIKDGFGDVDQKVEQEAGHKEQAVREALDDQTILMDEWEVYEVSDYSTSTEFHHDGVFDDLIEE